MSRRSVDLPQPDGPMSETNSPAPIVRSIPSSAVTAWVPDPNVLPAPDDGHDRALGPAPEGDVDGGADGAMRGDGLRLGHVASMVRYLPLVTKVSATRTMPTKARPTNVHMMIVTHSRAGAVT